jgi:DNA (cytosine-5)-methyltransferase 1
VTLKFIDLFAGLGGFHKALQRLGHECVFVSEIDDELRTLYGHNFPDVKDKIYGDICEHKDKVPPHDILCAGFPCQPFSKSGSQKGVLDKTRGTLFHEIIAILENHRPEYVILENVGNFERHDKGQTWQIVRESLEALKYEVRGTEHVTTGGSGLLSPHHLGFPHSRERFFIVGRLGKLPPKPFPQVNRRYVTSLDKIVQPADKLSETDKLETRLSKGQHDCIEHWNSLLARLPQDEVRLPSFPIWGDEFSATYPFEDTTPYSCDEHLLAQCLSDKLDGHILTRDEMLALLPSYARAPQEQFPLWKRQFIRQNRAWFQQYRAYFSDEWINKLRSFPPSHRKLEWNCKGEERDLWKHILQFRPSGLRVKRYNSSPALVAMTETQIPILGPHQRFLTRIEGLRLQGFLDDHKLPASRAAAFKALGNAVHVDVVEAIARRILPSTVGELDDGLLADQMSLATTNDIEGSQSNLPLFALSAL